LVIFLTFTNLDEEAGVKVPFIFFIFNGLGLMALF